MPLRNWLVALGCIVALGIMVYACAARAHIKERPELDAWMNGLQSNGGYPCCSHVDGTTIADVDWDTAVADGKLHYRVRIEGEWIVVTDAEVVESPNKFGRAIAWIYRTTNDKPLIRCFLPGAGG